MALFLFMGTVPFLSFNTLLQDTLYPRMIPLGSLGISHVKSSTVDDDLCNVTLTGAPGAKKERQHVECKRKQIMNISYS